MRPESYNLRGVGGVGMLRFTIRPSIADDELFSSYIQRTAVENGRTMGEALMWMRTVDKVTSPYAYYLDLYPRRYIDFETVENLLGLSEVEVLKHTYEEIYTKFGGSPTREQSTCPTTTLKQQVLTRWRKFCPMCLKNNLMFQKLWQLSGVEVCPIHSVILTTQCTNCGQNQPYVSDRLATGRCSFCESKLSESHCPLPTERTYQESQIRRETWGNLLNDKYQLAELIADLNKIQVLALKLLFLLDRNELSVPPHYLVSLRQVARSRTEPILSISKFIRFLHQPLFSLADVETVMLEDKFIQETLSNRLEDAGTCLAPWCDFYGTSDGLTSFSVREVGANSHQKVRYCSGCSLKFGINVHSGDWEEIGTLINVGWSTVVPMFERGCTQKDIIERVFSSKKNYDAVHMIIGYFAGRGQLSDALCKRLCIPKVGISDVETLISLEHEIGHKIAKLRTAAHRRHKWGAQKFCCVYQSSEFQKYLYLGNQEQNFDPRAGFWSDLATQVERDLQIMVSKNSSISVEKVAAHIGVASETLRSRGITKIIGYYRQMQLERQRQRDTETVTGAALDYIVGIRQAGSVPTVQDVLRKCGRSRKWFMKNAPALYEQILQEVAILRETDQKRRDDKLVEAVKMIIRNLLENTISPSFPNIVQELGWRESSLYRNKQLYKRIRAVRQAILESDNDSMELEEMTQ